VAATTAEYLLLSCHKNGETNIQIVTGIEVEIGNFGPEIRKMLPEIEDQGQHFMNSLFVLLYLKMKTKHFNKNYLNANHLMTSLLPVNVSPQC